MSKLSKQAAKKRKRVKLTNVEPPKKDELQPVICPKCGLAQFRWDYCSLCGQDIQKEIL